MRVIGAFLLLAQAAWGAPFPDAELTAILDEARIAQGIPGLVAAIGTRDGLWERALGETDVENHVAARADSVFRLASISKTLTAVTAMQLWRRGKLGLDGAVQAYCPTFPEKPWPITPRQLLGHLSGIRHYRDDEPSNTKAFPSVESALVLFQNDPLLHAPGDRFTYTTYGYNLLGCVLEGAAGLPFVELLQKSVMGPAGMTLTRDDSLTAIIPNRALGYVRGKDGVLHNSGLADTSSKIPGGGLVSTAGDLVRYGQAILDGKIADDVSKAAMWTEQKTAGGKGTAYGLGWALGGKIVGHTGGQERVSTVVLIHPEARVVVAVLTNLEDAHPQAVALKLMRKLGVGPTALAELR